MKLSQVIDVLIEKGLKASLVGSESEEVFQVASLLGAETGNITFFSDKRRASELEKTKASAVLLTEEMASLTDVNKIIVDDPYVAYAFVAQRLNKQKHTPQIHSSACIAETAIVPPSCRIDAGVYIAEDVVLGENCTLGAGSVVEKGSKLGDDCYLYPNVTVMHDCLLGNNVTIESGTVIGGQGFGFANKNGKWLRIPQVGRVIIGNNCWIGNNCAIDRGAIEDTIIADDCILDNLIHMAHNVEIGEGSAIAGQVGFAGSAKIGKYCMFAGQVGVNGHISVSDKSQFGAKAGVTHTIKQPGSYSGFPAIETSDWQKSTVRLRNLDKMSKKIKQLEQELENIKKQLED